MLARPDLIMLLAIPTLGGWEFVILIALALILFGKRLPEVGKSLGRSIVEFKKGLSGSIGDDQKKE